MIETKGQVMDGRTTRQLKSQARERLRAALDRVVTEALDDQRIVGTVVQVAVDDCLAYQCAAGLADREAGRPMTTDSIFLLSSVTKPFVTVAALALIQSGAMHLNDAVSEWLPAFAPRLSDGSQPRITIRHLLTHSAGLSYVFMEQGDGPYHRCAISGLDDTDDDLPRLLRKLNDVPLVYAPGDGWGYSMGLDVLGAIIERVTASTLPEAIAMLVTRPMAMDDTAFSVTDSDRLVVHYGDGPRRLVGDDAVSFFGNPVRFSPGRMFNPQAFPSGSAGMTGTAGDVMRLLESLEPGIRRCSKKMRSARCSTFRQKRAGRPQAPAGSLALAARFSLIRRPPPRRKRAARCNGMAPTATNGLSTLSAA